MRMPAGRLLTAAWSLLCALGGCSHYALRVPDTGHEAPIFVTLPDSVPVAAHKIEKYLKLRGHYDSTYRPFDHPGEVRINEAWIRDSSLRFYMRYWDHRIRHLSGWRAQWVLKELPSGHSELRVKVLEILFVGLPEDAEEGPDLDNKQSWFETNFDELRAGLEMRRFWATTYPVKKMPLALFQLKAPDLIFEPISKEEVRRFWTPPSRLRAF